MKRGACARRAENDNSAAGAVDGSNRKASARHHISARTPCLDKVVHAQAGGGGVPVEKIHIPKKRCAHEQRHISSLFRARGKKGLVIAACARVQGKSVVGLRV